MPFNGPPSRENEPISREKVIELLKDHGLENPEAKKALIKWVEE